MINAAGSLTTHTWDLEDRMTKVEVAGGAVNTMTYDGDGKRRRTEDSEGLRNVIWDQENIALETDSGNSTVAAYTLAPQGYGNLISQRRSGATSFHHFDALGSTDRLTDSSQNALITYLYRAFGQQTMLSGSHANRMTWGGRRGYYRQPDPANYWLRARIYRDLAGRFLSTDPLRGANPYAWPGNNPVMLVDPSGREGCYGQPGHACHRTPPTGGGGRVNAMGCPVGPVRGAYAQGAMPEGPPGEAGMSWAGAALGAPQLALPPMPFPFVHKDICLMSKGSRAQQYWTYCPQWHVCPGTCGKPPDLLQYEQEHAWRQSYFGTEAPTAADYGLWLSLRAGALGKLLEFPNASAAATRFFAGSGGERTVNLSEIAGTSKEMQQLISQDISAIRQIVCRRCPRGCALTLGNGLYAEVHSENRDWDATVGGMVLWPEASARVRCTSQGRLVATVYYRLHLWDPYWEWGGVEWWHLHVVGLAREFVHVGELRQVRTMQCMRGCA